MASISAFAKYVTDTVALPDGAVVTIHKLNPKQLGLAQKTQMHAAMRDLKDMGGPAFLKEIQDGLKKQDEATQQKAADPLSQFDPYILLEKGISGWSYDERVTADAIVELDEEPRDLIARAILKLTKPGLFQTNEEREAARKNG